MNPLPATAEAAVDRALVGRFTAGDEAAFVEIMQRHRSKIYRVTLGLLHNHADAEEITQDTFIRAHRALAEFRNEAALSTWLYRIAVNLACNRHWYYFRRRRQDSFSLNCALSEESTATLSDLLADPGQNPAQESVVNEFAALVDRCMERLDEPHREILTLRNVLNHSYEEIAATLGIRVGTVKSRIARARKSIRARLTELCPENVAGATMSEWFLPAHAIYGRTALACA